MSELIIDIKELSENISKIKDRINVDKFYYSLKANSDPIILKELKKQGCFFEIASVNEFEKVINVGENSRDIICGLPVKPIELLNRLRTEELEYFVFEDIQEYKKLQRYVNSSKKVMRIYITDIDKESAPWGIKCEDLEDQSIFNQEFFNSISGFTFHIARNYQIKKVQKVFDRIENILCKYRIDRKMLVNLGGGLRGELPTHLALKYDLNQYYDGVNKRIENLKSKFDLDIYCEPGRGIVESSCHIIADVELVTEKEGKVNVFIDLNIGTPVGTIPYKITVLHDGEEEEIYNIQYRMERRLFIWTTFFDTICEYENFFTLPLKRKLILGERIKMYGMGAYTVVRSNAFHSRNFLTSRLEYGR